MAGADLWSSSWDICDEFLDLENRLGSSGNLLLAPSPLQMNRPVSFRYEIFNAVLKVDSKGSISIQEN